MFTTARPAQPAPAALNAVTQRLAAFSLALLMTTALLASVEWLATSEPAPAQLARSAAQAVRG
ncbi:MAG: hypothetical protein IPM15_14070 [Betaproteobacteria bacterium]|nr:hypothetical protein [Betaproteobacteria bacterium]MCC6247757.1 hypothetical protein [Rubrivivax sp.]MCL4695912.1 hypothetical protein [Burkholderiaceae bacterium]